jgi:23S rRNA (cytidine1920-2'-O)/16S rRNA (cytidine1409-2'-O)-methyltransferase
VRPSPRSLAQRLDEAVAERTGVTRSRARSLIMAGRVRVDGRPATKPGATVAAGAVLDVERPRPYVSRGGEKLEAALAAFALDVRGVRALDVGASTGGFTDCLLAHGAAHVVALDVGYGQLAFPLRDDPRVTVIERTNFRLVPDGALGAPFDLVTIDASFISVVTLAERANAFLVPDGVIVALIKPQFEAGRERLGGGGVVRDESVRVAIVREVRDALVARGLIPVAAIRSPLLGPAGNVEAFFLLRREGVPVDDAALAAAAADPPEPASGVEPADER